MKNTIQIFINQRFWKEIPATVDSTGNFDYAPALTQLEAALAAGTFTIFSIRKPNDLTSIELRPVMTIEQQPMGF
jgi:hypothetical protein